MPRVRAQVTAPSLTRRCDGACCWISLWIALCQFSLPVVHAHPADAAGQQAWAAHLDWHHRAASQDPQHWHWHLVMPWELGPEPSKEDGSSRWGPPVIRNPVADFPERDAGKSNLFPDRVVFLLGARLGATVDRVTAATTVGPSPCFLSTYAGVSLVTLVCVSLR